MSTSITTAEKKASSENSTKVSRKGQPKQLSFKTYIHKTLKNVQPGANISKTTTMQVDIFTKVFATKLASLAINIAHDSSRCTVGLEDLDTASQFILPINLYKKASLAGEKAWDSFNNSIVKNRALRSGLSFPPHLSEKFLRLQGGSNQTAVSKLSLSQCTPIYMAAMTEYVVSGILEASAEKAKTMKRQTITPRHLLLATEENEDFSALLSNLNFTWLGGGVVPYIHPDLIPSKEKQRKLAAKRRQTRKDTGTTRTPTAPRKALPGTKAICNIRRVQKTFGLLQRKEHFKRFVKEQASHYWPNEELVHFGAGVFEYLQLFVEDQVTNVFRESLQAMFHGGRETVELRDLQFVWRLMKPNNINDYSTVGVEHLAEPGVHRLATRAGVKRVGQTCYDMAREIMAFYVARILQASFLLMRRQKVKTVNLHYLRRGASIVGFNLPVDMPRRQNKRSTNNIGEDEEDEVPLPEEEPETETDTEEIEVESEDES